MAEFLLMNFHIFFFKNKILKKIKKKKKIYEGVNDILGIQNSTREVYCIENV